MKEASKPLVNRVAQSGLITLKLEEFFPQEEICSFDLKDYLFRELILREKDFRAALKEHDWSQYEGKNLAIHCSADAIIPMWAYMLVTVYAEPIAKRVFQGSPEGLIEFAFLEKIGAIDFSNYEDKRVIVKGCADKPVPPFAYAELTKKLRPVAKSIMFGEPCSTVPIYKKKK